MQRTGQICEIASGVARAYAICGEKTIIVDGGTSRRADPSALLRRVGAAKKDVSLLILTHNHPDHTALLPGFRELTGAPLLCHRAAAGSLSTGGSEPTVPRTGFARLAVRIMGERPPNIERAMEPELVIDSETPLAPYGVAGVVLPTPGHTPGSVSVVLDSGEAIIGDLVMKFMPGRPRLSFLSNDEGELIASLRGLLERGIHTFYLSHGGAVPRSDVERLVG